MQEMQRLAPADKRAEREVQGGQTAPAAGDDEILPGDKNQPIGILPAAAAAAAGLHLAVLHAAHGPQEAHLRPAARQLLQRPSATRRTTDPRCISNGRKLPSKFIENTTCNTVAPHSAKFLFLPDITSKATGVGLIVLIVLYVGSQLASTLIATATADPNQRRLMLLLPLVFVVILYRYPAGLLVYWITTNLWTIGQQYLIRRRMAAAADGGRRDGAIRQRQADAAAASGACRRRCARGSQRRRRRSQQRSGALCRSTARRARRRSVGQAAMSDGRRGSGRRRAGEETRAGARRSRSCSRRSSMGSGSTRKSRSRRRTACSPAASTARTWACSSAATGRRSTRCSIWPSASCSPRAPRRSAS